jgi:hypothetical protein
MQELENALEMFPVEDEDESMMAYHNLQNVSNALTLAEQEMDHAVDVQIHHMIEFNESEEQE